MRELIEAVPDVDAFLAMSPAEVGGKLLYFLNERDGRKRLQQGAMNWDNFLNGFDPRDLENSSWPSRRTEQVRQALVEALVWLEVEGLIVPSPRHERRYGWFMVSRKGAAIRSDTQLSELSAARLLPKEFLHPVVVDRSWLYFMRGDFDTAVMSAMKQVEVALRAAIRGTHDDYGVALAGKAFNPETGPLRDPVAARGEQTAMMNLFSGALGVLKNPHSHRNVDLEDPADAAAAIMLASQLMRIIDARSAVGGVGA